MDANDEPSSYPYDSRISLDYTYSMDKLSCVRELYFIHITFAYLVVLSGIACFTARLYPPIRQYHALFGRAYIVCMLWCMGSSLLVHNTGLPVGVLISFFIVLFGLTAGWVCAKLHQNTMHASVLETVQKVLLEKKNIDLAREMKQAISSINTSKTSWRQRMVSYKAAHGMLMFMSWINRFGRMFGSNQSGDFTCHTYPVYKKLDSPKFKGLNQSLTFVPIRDPDYGKLPWARTTLEGWGVLFSIGALLFAAGVGLVYVLYWDKRTESKTGETKSITHPLSPFYSDFYLDFYSTATSRTPEYEYLSAGIIGVPRVN